VLKTAQANTGKKYRTTHAIDAHKVALHVKQVLQTVFHVQMKILRITICSLHNRNAYKHVLLSILRLQLTLV
jgi:hypothetical protein